MWKVLAASERGVSHEKSDTPCQDALQWQTAGADAIVCAVADGLGTAPRSGHGSRLAADTAVAFLRDRILQLPPSSEDEWRSVLEAAMTAAADALRSAAGADDETVESFDTTLLIVAMTDEWTASAHVGDGAVVVWQSPDVLRTFSAPERNELANIVTPITVPNLKEIVRYRIERRAFDGIALLTDGLQPLSINGETDAPYVGFFGPLFSDLSNMQHEPEPTDVEDLKAFLQSPRVNQRTSDDKTLLWVVRSAAAPAVTSVEVAQAAAG
jgi:hypothetical protein